MYVPPSACGPQLADLAITTDMNFDATYQALDSRRREFCHCAGTPFSSLLKNLLKVQGGCHQMTVSPAAKVESLNAGVAGAVLLFEARRQRRRLLLRGGG